MKDIRVIPEPGRTVVLAVALAVFFAGGFYTGSDGSELRKHGPRKHYLLFAPDGFEHAVVLFNGTKEYKYFQFPLDRPLKITVEGPTKMIIKVRLLFDISMKGTQEYTLLIQEPSLLGGANEVGRYILHARKSMTSSLKGIDNLVPSKAHAFTMMVPEGRHEYTLLLQAAAARSAIIRTLVPRQAISRQKRGVEM